MPIMTTAHIARPTTASSPLTGFLTASTELLAQEDPQLHGVVCAEHASQESTLSLLADTGVVHPSVLACMAGVARPREQLVVGPTHTHTAIERLAAARACEVFGGAYANVLPHSLAAALGGVLGALAKPGDTVLDLRGEPLPADTFNVVEHDLTGLAQARLDEIAELVTSTEPAIIIAGGRHAPAGIDYRRLRAIADAANAVLVADISGVAGQIATGMTVNPVRIAQVTVTCTHTQLFGPRGAIVIAAEPGRIAAAIANTLRWSWSGATTLQAVAGKARALHLTASESFHEVIAAALAGAEQLAEELAGLGHRASHTELGSHVVLLHPEIKPKHAVAALTEVGVAVGGTRDDLTAGRLRLGTATLAQRRFGPSEIRQIAELLSSVLGATRQDGTLDEFVRLSAYDSVRRLLSQFPLPCYVPVTPWEDAR
ncbi:MAG TPA: hypothetical protein VF444_19270 [Pseudonocardiaceae bacterium]